jgi:hypothetical protein
VAKPPSYLKLKGSSFTGLFKTTRPGGLLYSKAGAVEQLMQQKSNGSCLCGQVQFELEGTFDAFYLCHCQYCQKDTDSAHAANLFSKTASLT